MRVGAPKAMRAGGGPKKSLGGEMSRIGRQGSYHESRFVEFYAIKLSMELLGGRDFATLSVKNS